jgi:hypothetical protein
MPLPSVYEDRTLLGSANALQFSHFDYSHQSGLYSALICLPAKKSGDIKQLLIQRIINLDSSLSIDRCGNRSSPRR